MYQTINGLAGRQEYEMQDAPSLLLKKMYESCCEEYRKRLCEAWEIPFKESWWMADRVGEGLFLADCWMPLYMQELRYVVENNVTHEAWMEYCDFVESGINDGNEHPRINFYSWFSLNARPEILNNG